MTKWGIISTAHINRLVLAGARESDQVDVVAVASRDQARAEAYARENGIERAYGSYEALLADPDVDAVYISLPNSLHVEWSIRALEAGKHVLCEKPFDRRPEQVERAFDAADRAGRMLTEAFMYRHNPQTARVKELVASGAIGDAQARPLGLQLQPRRRRRTSAWPPTWTAAPSWTSAATASAGRACSRASRRPSTASRSSAPAGSTSSSPGRCAFRGEVLAQFDCGFVLPDRDELEVVGDEGSLFLDDPWHARTPVIELRRDDGVEEIASSPSTRTGSSSRT